MTSNPWAKFYWNDWDTDAGLRLCTFAAQGLWMRLLCIASRTGGKVLLNGVPPSPEQLARLYGEQAEKISEWMSELEANGVFSKNNSGIILSRRMIRDYKKIKVARENGKTGGNPTLGKQKEIPALVNPPDNPPVNPLSGISISQKPEARSQKPDKEREDARARDPSPVLENEIPDPENFQNLELPGFLDRRKKTATLNGKNSSDPPVAADQRPEKHSDPPEKNDCLAAVEIWNEMAQSCGLAEVQRLTVERKKNLRARLRDCGGVAGWRTAMGKIRDAPFLLGENDRGWRADFDFVLRAKAFTKIMEGGYGGNSNGKNAENFSGSRRGASDGVGAFAAIAAASATPLDEPDCGAARGRYIAVEGPLAALEAAHDALPAATPGGAAGGDGRRDAVASRR